MADLTVQEFDDYAEFVQEWHAKDLDAPLEEARNRNLINEDTVRLRWQLVGQLDHSVIGSGDSAEDRAGIHQYGQSNLRRIMPAMVSRDGYRSDPA